MRAVGIDPSGNPARQSTGSELPLDVGTMKKLLATGLKPDACRDRAGTTALGVAAFLAYKAFEKSRAPPKRVVSQPEKKKKSKKRD